LPERIAQNDHGIAPRSIFAEFEAATSGNRGGQHRKSVCRSGSADDADGFALPGEIVFGAGADGGDNHGTRLLLKERHRGARKDARDANQAIRLAIRQRAHQQRASSG
jgi:hypothetical protein